MMPTGGVDVDNVDQWIKAMRPESLRYDYDGEQVGIAVLGVAPLDTPLKAFSKGDYKGYEFIDFR